MAITIVGLGPGDPALLTRQAWEILFCAAEVYARTGRHPTIAGLPAGAVIHTLDSLYDEAGDFATVYAAITARVLELGQRPEGVIYAVPGHPLVGEATVTSILEQAPAAGIPVKIVPGLSFIEPVLTALQIDGMAGLQVVDALEVVSSLHPPLDPDAPALLGQLYSREIAGDVKLTLMNQYPDEHPVRLVHAAGTAGEQVESIPLYALDHSQQISHLTTLYLPPLPRTSGFTSFQETIARLRGPEGCPWDQEQTHQSLRRGLMEETAEVLDALDANDMEALCEELGDLLLHIVMQTQIAAEEGNFTMSDVVAGIEAKIRRRHPHVFGQEKVASAEQVSVNWEAIKQRERKRDAQSGSALDGIPAALPALTQADAYSRKAVQVGFDWPMVEDVVDKVREEIAELLAAATYDEQVAEMGDVLFTIVNWARWLEMDAETALRLAIRRFRLRFQALERAAQARAGGIANLDTDEIEALWQEARLAMAVERE